MADEELWKRRFYLFMGARLLGLATFLAGVAVMFTDLLRPGGWPTLGAAVVVLGLIDAVAGPAILKRQWRREDAANDSRAARSR